LLVGFLLDGFLFLDGFLIGFLAGLFERLSGFLELPGFLIVGLAGFVGFVEY